MRRPTFDGGEERDSAAEHVGGREGAPRPYATKVPGR